MPHRLSHDNRLRWIGGVATAIVVGTFIFLEEKNETEDREDVCEKSSFLVEIGRKQRGRGTRGQGTGEAGFLLWMTDGFVCDPIVLIATCRGGRVG